MTIQITTIDPDRIDAFASIWIPWLHDTMGRTPEAEDLEVMADPAAYYRRTGGEAFLASIDGAVVGAVAIKGLGVSGFEFCKLVATEAARGHGAGQPSSKLAYNLRRVMADRDYTYSRSVPWTWRLASIAGWVSWMHRHRSG